MSRDSDPFDFPGPFDFTGIDYDANAYLPTPLSSFENGCDAPDISESYSHDSGIDLSPPVANPFWTPETSIESADEQYTASQQIDFQPSFDTLLEETCAHDRSSSDHAQVFATTFNSVISPKSPLEAQFTIDQESGCMQKPSASTGTNMAQSATQSTDYLCAICMEEFTQQWQLQLHHEDRHLPKISCRAHRLENHRTSTNSSVPFDSGYVSLLGTFGSADSLLQSPISLVRKFISFFCDALIEKAELRRWYACALSHHPSNTIRSLLSGSIREFAVDLASNIPTSWSSGDQNMSVHVQTPQKLHQALVDAVQMIRLRRPEIAQYIYKKAFCESRGHALSDYVPQADHEGLSREDRLSLLEEDYSWAEEINEVVASDDEELCAVIEPFREQLVTNDAFDRLARNLRKNLYNDSQKHMERIELHGHYDPDIYEYSNMHRVFSTRVDFYVHWDLIGFLRSQYNQEPTTLASVVVITGSALCAYASTCAEYAKTTWPRAGIFIIELLDEALRVNDNPKSFRKGYDALSLEVEVQIYADGKVLWFMWTDDTELLAEVAQQISWLSSALSSSPFGDQLAYARPSVQSIGSTQWRVSLEHEPLHPSETPCWLPLFCGAVIASGFPIPKRADGVGLEISLDLLAALAGVCNAVEFDGGVVMKGFSHMFVPVRKTGDCLQWHAITNQDPEKRLTYSEGISRCDSRALLDQVTIDDIQRLRPIVGWCSVAVSNLGSSAANYENIDYSGAIEANSSVTCAGGSLGFQQFGAAQLNFRFGGKDGKCHFQRTGPYQRIVSAAENTMVALYDTGEQRAWLVPASNVMLHMAQHRHQLEPFEIDGKPIVLDTDVAPGSSAKQTLFKNASVRLSDTEDYTFKDFILNTWSLLEFLIDQDVDRDRHSQGTSVKVTLREFLHGYEFKAVVQERTPFRRKEIQLAKTNGGWPLLLQDIDALVLFADGFEDIIIPANCGNAGLCRSWQRVPKGKDYLATTTKTLKDLYDVAGCRLSRKYLTSTHLQWHQGDSTLFDACDRSQVFECGCNRLQRIIPKSAIGEVVPPGFVLDHGAVIFGHPGHNFRHHIPTARTLTSENRSIYSQPNTSLKPVINLPTSFDSGFFEETPLDRIVSDPTLQSSPDSLTSGETANGDETDEDRDLTSFPRKRYHIPDENVTAPGNESYQEPRKSTQKRVKSDHQNRTISSPLEIRLANSINDTNSKQAIRSEVMMPGTGFPELDHSSVSALSEEVECNTVIMNPGLAI
ncbi:hypothetical protein P280DRAFT_554719 [Massarina eburnea CBS 473.64]|uniref:C2H2-type domain-containing protein n=1 Tax=Massarina eburnea CBS 473.64 TaxID=1395130 RepID=A0A6A6RIK4_9PLEO|nr:hypothetical protein P280DRAFT_554719 [Massarina eburnea CBS 473.64]